MTIRHWDIETFSELDLTKVGVDVYARHPSTRVVISCFSHDNGEIHRWDESTGDVSEVVESLKVDLANPEIFFAAWNSTFERKIAYHVLGVDIPLRRWTDPMIIAHTLSMPGSLEKVGKIVGLPEDKQKQKRGKDLIRLFSQPQKRPKNKKPENHIRYRTYETDPEKWKEFVEYCAMDVEAERSIHRRIERWQPPEHEWRLWRLDQRINERGYPIDRALVRQAQKLYEGVQQVYFRRIEALTGLDNGNSAAQITEWVKERGYRRPNLRKETVEKALRVDTLDPAVREVLELRQKASASSPKKYATIDRATADDDRLRYTMQFAGAGRTWRWAGRIAQFQNVPRPEKWLEDPAAMQEAIDVLRLGDPDLLWMLYDDPMAVIVSCIRPSIRAPEGSTFCIADLSSIENVVLGWLARCLRTIEEFRQGLDPYLAFGVYVFGMTYEALKAEKDAGDKSKRTILKPGKLGAGYRLGGGDQKADGEKTGLWGYAENMGVAMERDEAHEHVRVYREAYPDVVQLWYDLENASKAVVRGQKTTARVGHLTIDRSGPFMRIRLPSGRYLHYVRPKIEDVKTPWGAVKPTLTYEGVDQYTGKWRRISTHGGKLTENCVAEGTLVLTDRGAVPIEQVRSSDRVWDGIAFVSHSGVLSKGRKLVGRYHGVLLTPDHRVLTTRGWVCASESERHHRASCGIPYGRGVFRERWEEVAMEGPLRLRGFGDHRGHRTEEAKSEGNLGFLRLPESGLNILTSEEARRQRDTSFRRLAFYARAVFEPFTSCLPQLRRARNNGLFFVGSLFRGLRPGRRASLCTRERHGPDRQRQGVLPRERSLGKPATKQQQSSINGVCEHSERSASGLRSIESLRYFSVNSPVPGAERLARKRDSSETEFPESYRNVYDLADCGPRNRFAVVGFDGAPLIVHNCTQAVARDILAEGLERADNEDIPIVGHVHDEIIAEVPTEDAVFNDVLGDLVKCMTQKPEWAPDIPLSADGYESVFYRKD